MQNHYDLIISDLVIRIESPREMTFAECFLPFFSMVDLSGKPDVRIEIIIWTNKIHLDDSYMEKAPGIYQKDEKIIRRFCVSEKETVYRVEFSHNPGLIQIYVPETFAERFCNRGNLLIYLELERILLSFRRVILHASAVVYKERSYMFSAPSGGGKSTQATLWEKYLQAEILNGDKVVVKIGSDGCTGYGSPVAGSSSIYKNKGKQLEMITFLEKGNRNQVLRVKKSKAFYALYSEMVKSSWDEAYNHKLLDCAEEIMNKTRILFYSCTDKKEAVMCLKEHLEGILHEK